MDTTQRWDRSQASWTVLTVDALGEEDVREQQEESRSSFRKGSVSALATEQARELLARIAKGDAAAMEQFYRGYQSNLYRFALAKLSDASAAADLVNDVMMRVWQEAARYRGQSSPLTWLLGIAYHKVMDQLRARYRHVAEELSETQVDPNQPDPCQWAEASQESDHLRACMEALSEKHRTVLRLAFFEDLPYARIAEILGCPEGTVKTRVFHAKEMLKRQLSALTPAAVSLGCGGFAASVTQRRVRATGFALQLVAQPA